MQQTQTGKVNFSRMKGRLHAWFSKPANIILLIFLIALTVLTLYPLLSLLMDRILKRDSLGGGDIKLYFVVGLYLGLASTLFSLLLACVLGLIFAFLRKRFGKSENEQIPFGPSIAAAAAVMLLFGDPMVRWYLGLISAA